MTWEWKIGDPVDDANGGFMDAQNWTGDYVVEEEKREKSSSNNSRSNYHPRYSRDEYDEKKREEQRKEREKESKKFNEERKRRKEMEKLSKELKEEKKRKKEECERDPECVKKQLGHFKKKVLKDYYLFLRFEFYQEKSDIKFKEILEYEELLEKLEGKKSYSRKDFNVLKKENERVQYILSRMDGEYRINAIKLYLKNQKTITELEKRYPEKGFFKGLINEVFKSDPEPVESLEIELSVREKLEKVKTLKLAPLYETAKMQEAMDLLYQARSELSAYPKENQYLRNLNKEIGDLETEINNKLFKLINFTKKRLFLINRDKYCNNQFSPKPGMDLKLVKEDSEDIITVYWENKPVGIVLNNFSSDFEKIFSDTSQLKYLPKTSSAKYFYRYGKFDIFEINVSRIKINERLKQEKILKKYRKNELITIVDINNKDMEFSECMKFKLIKESDYKSTGKIGVYLGGEKIGLVSNSDLNLNLTTKAGNLENIPKESYAEYLLKYENKYPIARIIKHVSGSISKESIDNPLDDDILKEEIAYVQKSKYRAKTVRSLDGAVKNPSQIAEDTDIGRNSIYNTLKQLNEHGIIKCINPEVKRGKLYKLTDKGENIFKNLD